MCLRNLVVVALTLPACSGQLIVELGEDGTVITGRCITDADCGAGTCTGGQCVTGGGGGSPGGGGGNNNNDNPTPTQSVGEPCEVDLECESGRCEVFDGVGICTEPCTSICPASLVCLNNVCVPSDFCENADGDGLGPGCDNSICGSCDQNASCVASPGGFECLCNDGFFGNGLSCEQDACTNAGCVNGSCLNIAGSFTCSCQDDDGDGRPDWGGELCDEPIVNCPPEITADNNPCNNGLCVNGSVGFICNCDDSGFSGARCDVDVDECQDNPCLNGSTCVNESGSFRCECVGDFVGDLCEVDASDGCPDTIDDPNPCSNGGVCIEESGGLRCECDGTGFVGATCTVDIDECADDPCQNGATCTNLVNSFSCECPPGFEGDTCDNFAPCTGDLDCATDQFCDPAINTCAPDTCDPLDDRQCQGQTVVQCAANGSGLETLFTCSGRPGAFASTCETPPTGDAFCTCEDDWDCPANTECNVDRCVGTGEPATCRLPAAPFDSVLPTNEITWGGTNRNDRLATGSVFPEFTQVVMTPSVANLDDDNGDGEIDERDFPEIIYLTFCWPEGANLNFRDFRLDGVLRVIHGGGPEKGEDYMAICGDKVWLDDGTGVSIDETCECNLDSSGDAVDDPEPRFDSTMSPAIGDIDGDGRPEIVVHNEANAFEVYSARGELLATSRSMIDVANGAVTIANIDNDGLAELIMGRNVIELEVNGNMWEFTNYFLGVGERGGISQGPVACVADLVGDENMEIVGGGTLYRVPDPPDGITFQSDIVGGCSQFAAGTDAREFCEEDLRVVWDTGREGFCAVADVLGADLSEPPSPDNPLDGVPEVILIGEGDGDDEMGDNVRGHVSIIDLEGNVVRDIDYNRADPDLDGVNFGLGDRGGAPNVDDFDGDGFPEVGTAFSAGYGLTDFQPRSAACPLWTDRLESDLGVNAPGSNSPRLPQQVSGGCTEDSQCSGLVEGTTCNEETGECICLFNNWVRRTEDDSSELTGSSVFDFNGDGAAEVVYNDECAFRIYDGLTGNPLFVEPSESRTRIEYPVVADVDNDGNAEIVFGTSNESGFCGGRRPSNPDLVFNSGIEVWGDASDSWVSARRIWSQHAYHVTNVTENARIPQVEPKGWLSTNDRFYNIYRSNPRNFGVAPDLEVTAVQVTGGGGGCGSSGDDGALVVQVTNIGDLRVGPGIVVGFEGDFGGGFEVLLDDDGTPLRSTLANTVEPRDSIFLSVSYDPANNGEAELPTQVRVTVDASYDEISEVITFDDGRERECDESNNSRVAAVSSSGPAVDLSIGQVSVASCTSLPSISVIVQNQGTDPAPIGALVRLFLGDPNQGGTPIGEVTLNSGLPAGASTTVNFTPTSFPACRSVRIFAVVDPNNTIAECNDGNNQLGQAGATFCCGGFGG